MNMKMIFLLCAMLTCGLASAAAEFRGGPVHIEGQGLPLPWPFPWAKECPVEWEALQGRYSMAHSEKHEAIQLNITFLSKFGLRLVRVARLDHKGGVLSEGIAIIHDGQRSISLPLNAVDGQSAPIMAELKFYYSSRVLSCDSDYLVPILSLKDPGGSTSEHIDYRLIRIDEGGA
jgi:hypothetical protein